MGTCLTTPKLADSRYVVAKPEVAPNIPAMGRPAAADRVNRPSKSESLDFDVALAFLESTLTKSRKSFVLGRTNGLALTWSMACCAYIARDA